MTLKSFELSPTNYSPNHKTIKKELIQLFIHLVCLRCAGEIGVENVFYNSSILLVTPLMAGEKECF